MQIVLLLPFDSLTRQVDMVNNILQSTGILNNLSISFRMQMFHNLQINI